MVKEAGALIICGRGADLGDFKAYADDLVSTELKSRFGSKISIESTFYRDEFFDLIEQFGGKFSIKEFHIFSHSYGAALSIGYYEPVLNRERSVTIDSFARFGRRTPYLTVLNSERGMVFCDDFVRKPYEDRKTGLQTLFDKGSIIKLWGCNSGIPNWVFSDPVDAAGTRWTTDPTASAQYYYWRALNEQRIPKPSIAQAFANFFAVPVYAATSGSHGEVKRNSTWITTDQYRKSTGRWPTEKQILRLKPDRGDYKKFLPQ
jgi:hypothetical protein